MKINLVSGFYGSGINTLSAKINKNKYELLIEQKDNLYFKNWYLKPVLDIKQHLKTSSEKEIIFIALSELYPKSINDIYFEFKDFEFEFYWIYGDPGSCYYKNVIRFGISHEEFSSKWNYLNSRIINEFDSRINLVNLSINSNPFTQENDLIPNNNTLSEKLKSKIRLDTKKVFNKLEELRQQK